MIYIYLLFFLFQFNMKAYVIITVQSLLVLSLTQSSLQQHDQQPPGVPPKAQENTGGHGHDHHGTPLQFASEVHNAE